PQGVHHHREGLGPPPPVAGRAGGRPHPAEGRVLPQGSRPHPDRRRRSRGVDLVAAPAVLPDAVRPERAEPRRRPGTGHGTAPRRSGPPRGGRPQVARRLRGARDGAEAAAVIEARGLTKVYAGDVAALRSVDFTVAAGEFVAVMGPSGCGKSTLLHLLGALDTPTTGEVSFEGRPLSTLSDADRTLIRRRRIGFVFQFFNLVPVLSVEANVALPLVIDNQKPALYQSTVAEMLGAVGLLAQRHKLPSQLSGGEQQRVAIARALVSHPAALLADEPTGNLDHSTGISVMSLLRSFHDRGQTTVVVTHDPQVASFAQRVVFMR